MPKLKTARKRTREVKGAEVVTGSPYKQRVMEKLLKKSSKSQGKDKKKRTKKMTCRLEKPKGRKPANKKGAKETKKGGVVKVSEKRESRGEYTVKKCRKSRLRGGRNTKKDSRTDDDVSCNEMFSDSVAGEITACTVVQAVI